MTKTNVKLHYQDYTTAADNYLSDNYLSDNYLFN